MSSHKRWPFPSQGAFRRWAEKGLAPGIDDFAFEKPRGLCGKYIKIAERCTDAPWAYHEACFWTVVATALGRTVRAVLGARDVFSNLYTCVVGPSSTARKSTSVLIAKKLAEMLGVPMLPVEVTPEKLFQILTERPRGVLLSEEFSRILAVARKKYGQGLIDMLLELYDCPPDMTRSTKGGGDEIIREPFVCMLTAGTPDTIKLGLVSTDVTGGMIPRMLMVTRDERRRKLDVQPELNEKKMQALAREIQERLPAEGQDVSLRLGKALADEYAAFSRYIDGQAKALIVDHGESMAERLKVCALKVATLSTVLRGSRRMTEIDVHQGAGLVLRLLTGHGFLSSLADLGRDRNAQMLLKVEATIKSARLIPQRKLLRALHPYVPVHQLDKHVKTLEAQGKVKRAEGDGGRGPKTVVYEWVGD